MQALFLIFFSKNEKDHCFHFGNRLKPQAFPIREKLASFVFRIRTNALFHQGTAEQFCPAAPIFLRKIPASAAFFPNFPSKDFFPGVTVRRLARLGIIILVIVLGRPESRRLFHFRRGEKTLVAQFVQQFARHVFLFGVDDENA